MLVEQVARICHEANKAYCESVGDFSQKPWGAAPQWAVKSAIHGVEFHLNNPDASDAASHENWMKEKLADGWTYGAEKNEVLKTHPALLPFENLPQEQQLKDRLFRSIVNAFRDVITT